MFKKNNETIAFGTGMTAIESTLFSLLGAEDHFISSAFLFGNTNSLLQSFISHGIETSLLDAACASNLGDIRTLCIPVAHSSYHELGLVPLKEMGIADSLIRFSVGIEEFDDLRLNFERNLI